MITDNGKPRKPQAKVPGTPPGACPAPLQRLGAIRQREGISRRQMARHLGVSVSDVAQQEQQTTDIRLSELYKWREAMDVPLTELLMESDGSLSPPVLFRAQLIRAMKTAMSIREQAKRAPIQRLGQMLFEQLVEIMPELRDVQSWPSTGSRRTHRRYGRIVERSLPDSLLEGPAEGE